MKEDNSRKTGDDKELECVRYLINNGVKNIERNYRCRNGEIDIIGMDGEYLVFFEVKYRRNNTSGHAESSVGFAKQRQISRVSDHYRMKKFISEDRAMRFDVLAVNDDKIMWYKNAFDYIF